MSHAKDGHSDLYNPLQLNHHLENLVYSCVVLDNLCLERTCLSGCLLELLFEAPQLILQRLQGFSCELFLFLQLIGLDAVPGEVCVRRGMLSTCNAKDEEATSKQRNSSKFEGIIKRC